ncbi:MAG: YfcE family phosphodiesterase [Chloroflexi bacterium RBG_13_54_8]|nr:MAG: YfcE family phosphodiesterase [Chloroflexi bacterium RBG_13_54_8]
MRIGIMSDSHDNLPLIARAVELFNREKVSLVLHAGDFVSPFTANALRDLNARLVGVFGNNDGDKSFLQRRLHSIGELHEDFCELELDSRKIVLMHQPKFLEALIASAKYDLIVYGHTHHVDIRQGTHVVVVNPGECGGWLTGTATVATIDLETMTPTVFTIRAESASS